MFTIWIPGPPKGKDRPRFYNGRAVTTPETRAESKRIATLGRAAIENPLSGPVSVVVTAFVGRPKAHYRKGGELSRAGLQRPMPDNRKPDVDNLGKIVLDSLNGIAYDDDVQVVSLSIHRRWADEAGRAGEGVRVDIWPEY